MAVIVPCARGGDSLAEHRGPTLLVGPPVAHRGRDGYPREGRSYGVAIALPKWLPLATVLSLCVSSWGPSPQHP